MINGPVVAKVCDETIDDQFERYQKLSRVQTIEVYLFLASVVMCAGEVVFVVCVGVLATKRHVQEYDLMNIWQVLW